MSLLSEWGTDQLNRCYRSLVVATVAIAEGRKTAVNGHVKVRRGRVSA
jgi:hypothetical protein